MKRFLLSTIMVVIGLSAFSQSPSRFIYWQPAYPLLVGESTAGSVCFSNNGLCLWDVSLDSLPQYEIGQIDAQTARYSQNGYGFYLKADSLHSLNVTYSYEVKEQPMGTIDFNSLSGRFKYYPAYNEYKPFVVTFSATNGTETVSEDVEFNFMPQIPSEYDAFNSKGRLPDAGDYTTKVEAEASKSMYLNNYDRKAYSISISGKDVIFDDALQNTVSGLNGREDIYELNIYAERLIIRSALSFPETDITIYAKELIFEDRGQGVASINTTPSPFGSLVNDQGKNGANAGDIRLYIKDLIADPNIRFILNGAKGQSANRNGTPGNGGNGGSLFSIIDVSAYCDCMRGSGGIKYDVASDGSTNPGPAIGYGAIGRSGNFELVNKPYAYLHPYYIAAVIRHANDAFINNCTAEVLSTCREYRDLINMCLKDDTHTANVWTSEGQDDHLPDMGVKRNSTITDTNNLEFSGLISDGDEDIEKNYELQNDLLQINAMLLKLEQGLDYFGNPVGWVPMLSFEVYRETYDKEIDCAIPTLYLYYWLNRIDQTLQNKIKASLLAADATEKSIDDDIESLNALILEVPVLQDEAAAMTAQIENLTHQIEVLQAQLMAQATKNVKKKNWFQKLVDIAKTVVSCIPVVGNVVKVASGVVNAVGYVSNLFKMDVDVTPVASILSDLSSGGSNPIDFKQMLTDVKSAVQGVKLTNNMGSNIQQLTSAYKSVSTAIEPLESSIQKVYDVITQNTAPDSEIQAEYNKLIACSPLWHSLVNQVEELNAKKTELLNHIDQVFSDMATTMSNVSNDVLALDAFKRDVFIGNSKRDLNAMLYFEKMKQDAENRLLKYDYYLRKAYEYRMLKPYGGTEFNLVDLYRRAEKVGLAVDSVITKDDYETLASVFREDISKMTESIIDEYTNNVSEKNTYIEVPISAEQLEAINKGESVRLNIYDLGYFSPEEENIRIVNLSVSDLQAHVVGNAGVSAYMTLNMAHSGISQFRKDGQIYWFNHMSRNTANPHTWGVRYYPNKQEIVPIQPSVASTSLLSYLLNNNNDKILLFSRPSAWSDIVLSKTQHQANIVIDQLMVRLDYDYTLRPNGNRNINIMTNEGLLPYIACSEPDISGRSDGLGHLYRSYMMSNQSVTFSAIEEYGSYRFANWTDSRGIIVSNQPDLTVSRMTDQVYTANYERHVPVLDVPDTIRLRHNGGEYTVQVKNTGLGDQEMEWSVSDSLSTWVHLKGAAEGVDEGSFTFTYDANESKIFRIDSLEIYAPETDEMTKMIYIVQEDEPDTDISALDNVIYMNKVTGSMGQQRTLSLRMKNTAAIRGFQFDLYLPEGVTAVKNGKGRIQALLSKSRLPEGDAHTLTITEQQDGAIRFLCGSQYDETFTGTDGEIATLLVQIPADMVEGEYSIYLKAMKLTETNINKYYETATLKTTLVISSFLLGDVNGDGKVDVSDYIGVANLIMGSIPAGLNVKAADIDGNGIIDVSDYIGVANYIMTGTIFGRSYIRAISVGALQDKRKFKYVRIK